MEVDMRRFRHFLTCNKIHTLCYWLFNPLLELATLLVVRTPYPNPRSPVLVLIWAALISACNPPWTPYPPVSREKHDYETGVQLATEVNGID